MSETAPHLTFMPAAEECPPARNGCMCSCHTTPGIVHVKDCCPDHLPMSMMLRRELSEETRAALKEIDDAQRAAAVSLAANPPIVGAPTGADDGTAG